MATVPVGRCSPGDHDRPTGRSLGAGAIALDVATAPKRSYSGVYSLLTRGDVRLQGSADGTSAIVWRTVVV